jgi:hypothetical protein
LCDYLLLAAHLVPEKLDLAFETGYERAAYGVYPRVLYIVYPAGIPFVQVDVNSAVVFFVVLQGPTGDALADGALGDAKPPGGLLNRYPVQPGAYPASSTLSHADILDPSGGRVQADALLETLSAYTTLHEYGQMYERVERLEYSNQLEILSAVRAGDLRGSGLLLWSVYALCSEGTWNQPER